MLIAPRRNGSQPVFDTGPAATNQPGSWSSPDPSIVEVFHAMMLCRNVVEALGIEQLINPEYGPQRTPTTGKERHP